MSIYFLEYSETDKSQQVKGLKIQQTVKDKFSIFVLYGDVEPAGAGWTGSMSCDIIQALVLQECNLKDAVAFAYGGSMMRMAAPKLLSVHEAYESNEEVPPYRRVKQMSNRRYHRRRRNTRYLRRSRKLNQTVIVKRASCESSLGSV